MNLRDLCSILILHSHNVHVLHWKIRGLDFIPTHRYLDEVREDIEAAVDAVAEMSMQYGYNPPSYADVYEELGKIDKEILTVDSSENYNSYKVYEDTVRILSEIIDGIQEVYENSGITTGHQSDLDDIMSKMHKHRFLCQSCLQK